MKTFFTVVFAFAVAITLQAAITLPSFFTSNMVLQQSSQTPIWGSAKPGKKVTVTSSWDQKTYTVQADASGKWKVELSTPKAGFTPYTLTISDGKKLVLNNILIGEVWLASGQSNMEMPLADWGKVLNYEQEIATANFPHIRLLQVENQTATSPQTDLRVEMGGWVSCSPTTVAGFSSTAYFFARELFARLNVPVGVIHSSWGGTVAEAWTSGKSLKMMPDFVPAVKDMEARANIKPLQELDYATLLSQWRTKIESADPGLVDGKAAWAAFAAQGWSAMELPGNWEMRGQDGLDGIVWFQKQVQLPADWAGKELKLQLDMIDDDDITYFNGVEVGRTTGWNLERVYTVPASLAKAGQNVITVRVYDGTGNGGLYGRTENLKLINAAGNSIPLAGDWKYRIAVDLKKMPAMPENPDSPNRVSVLYNAMIHPLVPYTIQGAIWYQGESNASRAAQYGELFPLMIQDWRTQWKRDFSFYFVQLANYLAREPQPTDPAWAYLRDAQRSTTRLASTGMAVSIDIGDALDIHPKNKQEVGRRLALQALAKTYQLPVVCDGPVFVSSVISGSEVRLQFKPTQGQLRSADGTELAGFTVAGPDRVFYTAKAEIRGQEVVVSSPKVPFPMAVRYAWANNPACNLTDASGLPASPFRTDNW